MSEEKRKPIKFHIKIRRRKKETVKRKVYLFNENVNDIAEEEEEEKDNLPHQNIVHTSNSSIIIDDDSGCFSSDTSFKAPEEGSKSKRSRVRVTQRVDIHQNFWNINVQDDFVVIYVNKNLKSEAASDLKSENELSNVSVQMEGGFSVRNSGLLMQNGKKKNKRVVQRKNEWKKVKFSASHSRY